MDFQKHLDKLRELNASNRAEMSEHHRVCKKVVEPVEQFCRALQREGEVDRTRIEYRHEKTHFEISVPRVLKGHEIITLDVAVIPNVEVEDSYDWHIAGSTGTLDSEGTAEGDYDGVFEMIVTRIAELRRAVDRQDRTI